MGCGASTSEQDTIKPNHNNQLESKTPQEDN